MGHIYPGKSLINLKEDKGYDHGYPNVPNVLLTGHDTRISRWNVCDSREEVTSRPKFQTASGLRFDIEQTDSLAIDIGERVCLVGKCSTPVDRLVITALLPERHGGFGSPHVTIIDGGNQSDIYQCVDFARQYGLDIKDILRRILVSRAFTIYQLVDLITNELPKLVRRFDTKSSFFEICSICS